MAELALKNAVLINGGAAIALMTFLGNAEIEADRSLILGLFTFSSGVLFGAVATFFGYLSQSAYMDQINGRAELKVDIWQRRTGIVLCGLSYLAFAFGISVAAVELAGNGI